MKNLLLSTLLVALAGTADASETHRTPSNDATEAAAVQHTIQVHVASEARDAFGELDADHDGTLSRAELARHPKAAHMAMVDEDGDGVLDRDEFDALQEM